MSEQRTALVTGGTGFVGLNLINGLIAAGWTVHAIVRSTSARDFFAHVAEHITVHEHDESTECLIAILLSAKPDVVFHAASLVLPSHMSKDIAPLIQSNVLFGTQLLQAMNETGVNNVVNTGTSWQQLDNKHYSPVNLYAATKQAYETILQYFVEATSIKAITLRLYDTYGPNDPRAKLLSLLNQASLTGETLALTPGDQYIDLVFIDDVIDAYMLAAIRLCNNLVSSHEIYSVSSGKHLQLRELVKIFSEAVGRTINVNWGARPYRLREVMRPCSIYPNIVNWTPKTAIKEGIMKTCLPKNER